MRFYTHHYKEYANDAAIGLRMEVRCHEGKGDVLSFISGTSLHTASPSEI